MKVKNFYLLLISIFVVSFFLYSFNEQEKVKVNPGGVARDDSGEGNFVNLEHRWDSIRESVKRKIQSTPRKQVESEVYNVRWSDDLVHVNDDGSEARDLHPMVAIITSNKPNHLRRLLKNLIEYSSADKNRILVFTDGKDDLSEIVKAFDMDPKRQLIMQRATHEFISDEHRPKKEVLMSTHYLAILKTLFNEMKLENAILLEDDLVLTHDAIEYFTVMSRLYKYDKSLFCITGWNDNAFLSQQRTLRSAEDAESYRFSFKRHEHLGGLGWVLNSRIWHERIEPNWGEPNTTAWDINMQRMFRPGDTCIYPESSRTHHAPKLERDFNSILRRDSELDMWYYTQFYSPEYVKELYPPYQHEKRPKKTLNLGYLLANEYDNTLSEKIRNSIEVKSLYIVPLLNESGPFVFYFKAFGNNDMQLHNLALERIGVWGRGNGNIVRNVYKGVLEVNYYGKTVFVVTSGSPFYTSRAERDYDTKAISDSQVFGDEKLTYITDNYDKALIIRAKNDRSLFWHQAEPHQSCREVCTSHNYICMESELRMLQSKVLVQHLFSKQCQNFETAENMWVEQGYMPAQINNSTCVLPATVQKISCTNKPEDSGTRKLCVCKKSN